MHDMVELCVLMPGEALCGGLVTRLDLGDGRQLIPDWQRLGEQAVVVFGNDAGDDRQLDPV